MFPNYANFYKVCILYTYNTLKRVLHIMKLGFNIGLLCVTALAGMAYDLLRKTVVVSGQPLWENVLSDIFKIAGVLFLGWVVWNILKRIKGMDEIDNAKDIDRDAKLDALIENAGITQEQIDKQKPQLNNNDIYKVNTKPNVILRWWKHKNDIKTVDNRPSKEKTSKE